MVVVGTSLSLTFTNFVIEAFVSRYLEKFFDILQCLPISDLGFNNQVYF